MANLDLATLKIKITAETKEALDGMGKVGDEAKKQADKATNSWQDAGKTLSDIGGKLTKSLTLPIVATGTACVKLASDLTETLGKTEVVFGEMSDAVISWSENAVENMGLAQETALNMASTYGDLGTSMGLTTAEAANMSMNMVQLAADMASFKNISVERANVALQAIYTGETESLKAMGIVMTEANLEAFAMNEGLSTTYKNMSQTEKVMLRYRYVMSMTTNAQGDFVRTGDSLANQTRKLGQNLKELGASFGKILEPAITSIISSINNVVSWFRNLDDTAKRVILTVAEIVAGVPAIIAAVGGIITVVGKLQGAITLLSANPLAAAIAVGATAIVAMGAIISNVNKEVDKTSEAYTAMTKTLEKRCGTNIDTSNVNEAKDAIESLPDAKDIDITVSVSPEEKYEETVQGLIDKTNELKGDKTAIGKFEISPDFDSNINEYMEAMAGATIAVSNFDDTVGNIDAILDRMAAEQKAAVITKMLADSQAIYNSYMAGTISEEKYNQMMEEVATSAQNATIQIDANTQALKENNQQFVDGEIDTVNWGQNYASGLGLATNSTNDFTIATDTAAASINALANGTGTATDAAVAWTFIQQEQIENQQKMADAENVYNEELATANKEYERTVDYQQKSKEYAEQLSLAYTTMAGSMAGGMSASEAFNDTLKRYPELAADLIEQTGASVDELDPYSETAIKAGESNEVMKSAIDEVKTGMEAGLSPTEALTAAMEKFPEVAGQLPEALGATFSTADNLYFKSMDLADAAEAKKKECDQAIEEATAKHQEAMTAAEENYTTTMSGITSTYTADQVATIGKMCQDEGLELSQAEIENTTTAVAMMEGIKGAVADGSPEVVAEAHTMVQDMNGAMKPLKENGITAGGELINGMIQGLNGKEGSLYDKVRFIVREAISAAKQEADIHSPSRKTRNLIGKPFMEGIEVGMNDYLPNLVKTTKKNMSSIITAGTGTINSNYKLQPASNTTNIARQGNTTINQTNNFTSRTLSPYEQQQQIRKMNKQLAEVFA